MTTLTGETEMNIKRNTVRAVLATAAFAMFATLSVFAPSADAQTEYTPTADPWHPVALCASGGDFSLVPAWAGGPSGGFGISADQQQAAVRESGRHSLGRAPAFMLTVTEQYELASLIRAQGNLSAIDCSFAYASCSVSDGIRTCYVPVPAVGTDADVIRPGDTDTIEITQAVGGCLVGPDESCLTVRTCRSSVLDSQGVIKYNIAIALDAFCTSAVSVAVTPPNPSVPAPTPSGPVPAFTG